MKQIGVAVVGASGRSGMIFRFLQEHPEQGRIVGAYDPVASRCRQRMSEYGCPDAKLYKSVRQAVNDPDAQAVFVMSIDCAHASNAIAALRAGKHVFCEKPMALTMRDCDRIAEEADKAGVTFYVGMNMRHGPVHSGLHKILRSGQLGKLLTIEANEYYYGGRTYFRRWNRLRKFGGGLWLTKACHDFDLLNWFAGGNPTRVFAAANLSHYKPRENAGPNCRVCKIKDSCQDYWDLSVNDSELRRLAEEASGVPRDICLFNSDKDTFDNGIAVVEYDNDVRATYTVNVVSSYSTRQMRLVGTDGQAEGDYHTGEITTWKRHTREKTTINVHDQMTGGHGGADDVLLPEFFNCVRTGTQPLTGWREGRMSIAVGLAATKSSDTGKAVNLKL